MRRLRRVMIVLLAVLTVCAMAACGRKDGKEEETLGATVAGTGSAGETAGSSEPVQGTDEMTGTNGAAGTDGTTNGAADESMDTAQGSESAMPGETPAKALLAEFQELAENGEISAEEMANQLVSYDWIPFGGMAMAVEPGYLAGFSEEIDGFETGATFGPVISSIPFVGYVFRLEEGADVAAFVENLKEQADLRWNICTEADEMVCEAVDNTVFFVMSPAQFE